MATAMATHTHPDTHMEQVYMLIAASCGNKVDTRVGSPSNDKGNLKSLNSQRFGSVALDYQFN